MSRKTKTQNTTDQLIDELLREHSSPEEILGKSGLLQQLTKRVIERALKGELSHYLQEEIEQEGHPRNSRNGYSQKTIQCPQGEMRIDIPRDRHSEFTPMLVPKGEKRIRGLDEKIISLYARGMSTRDIQEQVTEMYGVDISHGLISQITAEISEEVREWQQRPLEKIYPITWLDALRMKVRHEGRVTMHIIYIALGVNVEGQKEVLGMWMGTGGEGAKFWLSVLNDIRNRGVEQIFIACVDGLKGFPAAIEAVFPQTKVQLCIVHLIRNSLQYVSWKDRKQVVAALKPIYRASTVGEAESGLTAFAEAWDDRYPTISQLWLNHWDYIIPFFDYPPEIRKVIYTTNAIESLNRSLRKVTKTKGVFPSQESVMKLLYLALRNIARKWTMPIQNWKAALSCFAIEHPDTFLL